MAEYTDYVLCMNDGRKRPFLAIAPAFTHLKEGDVVIIDTESGGQVCANVVASESLADGDSMIDYIIKATGTDELCRISSIMILKELNWEGNNE